MVNVQDKRLFLKRLISQKAEKGAMRLDRLISDYALTAVEVILACVLIGTFITVYTVCNQATTAYNNDTEARVQQELYAKFAQYDDKTISDTKVLNLMAKGVNLPNGIKIYLNESASSPFITLGCNETVNIGDSSILEGLRVNIPAGTSWSSDVVLNENNGEISHIEIRYVGD